MYTNDNLKHQVDGIDASGGPPKDWSATDLFEVSDIQFSNVDKHSRPGENPVLLCNYLDVYNNNYIDRTHDFMVASASNSEMNSFKINFGDVILTKDSETPDDIGVPAVVLENIQSLVCGYHLALLRPYQTRVDPVFLAKQFATDRIIRYFSRVATGTTRYGLGKQAVKKTKIWLPPLREQRKIAEILTTVDRQIEKTEALIAKYQAIKKGMVVDLLTCGIDSSGQLRPPPSKSPNTYKDTVIGKIPTEWSVFQIGDLASVQSGYAFPSSDFCDSGIPIVRMDNLKNGTTSFNDAARIPEKRLNNLDNFLLKEGDLLVGMSGSLESYSVVKTEDIPCYLNQRVGRFLKKNNDIFYPYLYYVVQLPIYITHVQNQSAGVAQANISSKQIESFKFGLPKFDEQKHIHAMLSTIENKIWHEKNYNEKLKFLKQGLMQNLLTGKFRVHLGKAEEAVANA